MAFTLLLEQTRRLHALCPRGECARRAAPFEPVYLGKKVRVRPQRREILEQERELAIVS